MTAKKTLDGDAGRDYTLIIQKIFSYGSQMDSDYDLFRRIVEAGSLSAAARGLRLSPSMVSKRLSRLETRLGAALIHRSTRKLTPTPVGQIFYEEVSYILSRATAAEARVAGQAERPCGRLRIAAPNSFGRVHIAPHLRSFLDLYDQVEIELLLDDSYVDLLEKKIDVAIRITLPPDSSYDYDLLAPNRRVLCASPGYVDKFGNPASIQDLANHRLLTAQHQSPWRLEGPKGDLMLDVKSRIQTNCSDVVREAAVSGLGIALRSSWDISEHLKNGTLVRVLPKWHGASDIGIYAVRPRAILAPVTVRAFGNFLKSVFGEMPYWDAHL